MKIKVVEEDNYLFIECNGFRVIEMLNPGHKLVDTRKRKASIKKLLVSPSSTLDCIRMRRYLIPATKRYLYALGYSYDANYKCHSLYETNNVLSHQMRAESVLQAKSVILEEESRTRTILNKLIKMVLKSYEFDYVLTDTPELFPDIKTINIENIKIPTENSALSFLSRGGVKSIPITSLDGQSLVDLDLSFDGKLATATEGKSVLVFTWVNRYLPHYILKRLPVKEGLPLVGFSINAVESQKNSAFY